MVFDSFGCDPFGYCGRHDGDDEGRAFGSFFFFREAIPNGRCVGVCSSAVERQTHVQEARTSFFVVVASSIHLHTFGSSADSESLRCRLDRRERESELSKKRLSGEGHTSLVNVLLTYSNSARAAQIGSTACCMYCTPIPSCVAIACPSLAVNHGSSNCYLCLVCGVSF